MKSVQSKNITTADASNQLFQKETKKSFFSKSKKPFFTASPVQTKLSVNQPNDPYEQEADAMADKVVQDFGSLSSGNISSPFFSAQNNSLQRKCAECEKEDEEKKRP